MSRKLALSGLPSSLSKAEAGSYGLLNKSLLSRFLKEDQINLSEIIPDEIDRVIVNGRVHRIKVEIFNTGTLEKMLKSADENGPAFGVYPDPALYWRGDDYLDFPISIVSREGDSYSTADEIWTAPYASDIDDIDDAFNAYVRNLRSNLDYPIFAVTSEEIDDENGGESSNPFTRGLEKSASGNGYLTLLGIRLYVERDGLTKDEFESWYNELNVYGYNIRTGSGKLNGGPGYRWKHNDNGDDRTIDAGGYEKKLQDVNAAHIWYDQGSPFRLFPLNDIRILMPFDDDHNEGEMSRDNGSSLDKENWKVYNPADSSVSTNEFWHVVDNELPQSGDEDDRYGEGGVWNVTAAAIKKATDNGNLVIDTKYIKKNGVVTEDGLPDMRWKLGWIEF